MFTSAKAVDRFMVLLHDARSMGSAKGGGDRSRTAAALRRFGVIADLVPLEFVAESLLEASRPEPRTSEGSSSCRKRRRPGTVLVDGLREKSWMVDVVEAYRTSPAKISAADAARGGEADAIVFTSSSSVTSFIERRGQEAVPPVVACIGPVTAATARDAGLVVASRSNGAQS